MDRKVFIKLHGWMDAGWKECHPHMCVLRCWFSSIYWAWLDISILCMYIYACMKLPRFVLLFFNKTDLKKRVAYCTFGIYGDLMKVNSILYHLLGEISAAVFTSCSLSLFFCGEQVVGSELSFCAGNYLLLLKAPKQSKTSQTSWNFP